jgi:hypothetical protein
VSDFRIEDENTHHWHQSNLQIHTKLLKEVGGAFGVIATMYAGVTSLLQV